VFSIIKKFRLSVFDKVTVALLAAALIVLWMGADALISKMMNVRWAEAEAEAEGMSTLASANWTITMAQVAHLHKLGALATIEYTAGSPSVDQTLETLREATAAAGPAFRQVAATDTSGLVIWSTLPMPKDRVSLSDREHIRAILEGRDSFVGIPVRGRVSGQETIQLSHAVRSNDKRLIGVVVVSVSVEAVDTLSTSILQNKPGILAVLRDDGAIVARAPATPFATSIDPSEAFFRHLLATNASQATRLSSIDQVLRFTAGKRLPDHGLSVIAAIDAEPELADVRRHASIISSFTIALTVMMLVSAAAICYARRRRNQAVAATLRLRTVNERETTLRHIASRASDMIALLDDRLCYVYANSPFTAAVGISAKELVGRRFDFFVPPELQSAVSSALHTTETARVATRVLLRTQTTYNGLRLIEADIVPLDDGLRDFPFTCRYLAVCSDVTEREQTLAALQQVEAEFATLATLGPARLYRMILHPPGAAQRTFPGEGHFLGYSLEQLSDHVFFNSLLSGEQENIRQIAYKSCEERGSSALEYSITAADGSIRWLRDEMRLTPNYGDIRSVVGALVDITDERKTQARLRQAERLATLGELSASIAHEIKQPLTVIAATTENALALSSSAKGKGQSISAKLEKIRDQIARLDAVINHIKRFGRGVDDTNDSVELPSIIEATQILVGGRLRASGTKLLIDIPDTLPTLRGSAIVLEQVLTNLIVNACDAYAASSIPIGKRSVLIAARTSGSYVRVLVSDQAGGIPEELMDRIFLPFVTTKQAGHGTGLGLAICSRAITEMGGSVAVCNRNGGAQFEVQLQSAETAVAA